MIEETIVLFILYSFQEAKQKLECAQLNMENLAAQEEVDNARIAKETSKLVSFNTEKYTTI